MATRVAKSTMSDSHKAALAKGREEGRIVRSYLEGLEAIRPKRGRKRTPESIEKRLADIADEYESTDSALTRLHLIQEESDLEAELAAEVDRVDIAGLEKAFIKVANSYGQRKGISYSSWRSIGVSASVLQHAGVTRARG